MGIRVWTYRFTVTAEGLKHGHQVTFWTSGVWARKRRIAKKQARILFGKRIKPRHYTCTPEGGTK